MRNGRGIALLLGGVALLGLSQSLRAQVVVAGTCKNFLPHFSTIQAAVNAANAGGTVLVCPGTYPEQVVINKTLRVRGDDVEDGQLSAIITSPAGGMVPNSFDGSGTPVSALIAVQQAQNVSLQGLIVDASNNGYSLCTSRLAGIAYLASSGLVRHVEVRNVSQTVAGCRTGSGIRADNPVGGSTSIAVSGSSIHDYLAFGVVGVGTGTQVLVLGNVITGNGASNAISQAGVELASGATGTVIANKVSNHTVIDASLSSTGIFGVGAHGVRVGGNDVSANAYGISLQSIPGFDADSGVIAFNKVSGSVKDSIWLCSNNNVVQSNAVLNSGQAGIDLVSTCGGFAGNGNGDTIKGNLIDGACAGVLESPGVTGDTLVGNNFKNVTNQVLTGTSCP